MAPKNEGPQSEGPTSWDIERRVHEMAPLEMHLSGSTMYIPARLKTEMDRDYGGPVPAVKTRTFVDAVKVWIATTTMSDKAARKVRTSKTLGSAEFGFGIPLRKLGLAIPPGRQLNFPVKRVGKEGQETVYEISFADYANLPRDIDLEAIAAAKKAKAEKAKARRAARRAK